MDVQCVYGFGRLIEDEFEDAQRRVEQGLQEAGFKIYSRIDLQRIIQDELGKAFRRYLIIGACNAGYAHQAFVADPNIGLLLPCNVIVYEDDDGRCRVMASDPARIMDLVREPAAIEAAIGVREKLEQLISKL